MCGCTPRTTCPAGDNCGSATDGCGEAILCGACSSGDQCIGNQCSPIPPDAGAGLDSGSAGPDAATELPDAATILDAATSLPDASAGVDAAAQIDSGADAAPGADASIAGEDSGAAADAGETSSLDAAADSGTIGHNDAGGPVPEHDAGTDAHSAVTGCGCSVQSGRTNPLALWGIAALVLLGCSRRNRRRG